MTDLTCGTNMRTMGSVSRLTSVSDEPAAAIAAFEPTRERVSGLK